MGEYQKKNELTKQKIKDSILKLTSSISFDKITVGSIADKANINRVTFYRHFDNKWEVIEEIEDDFFSKLKKPHEKMISRLAELNNEKNIPVELIDFLDVIKENLPLLSILMGSRNDFGFSYRFFEFMIDRQKKSHPFLLLEVNQFERELFANYSISSFLGIIRFWILHPTVSSLQISQFFMKVQLGATTGLKTYRY